MSGRRGADLRLRARTLLVLAVPWVPLVASAALVALTARQARSAQEAGDDLSIQPVDEAAGSRAKPACARDPLWL